MLGLCPTISNGNSLNKNASFSQLEQMASVRILTGKLAGFIRRRRRRRRRRRKKRSQLDDQ